MASQQTVLTSPQQVWKLQGDNKTHSDKITRMTCWLQKYLQWLHCLSSTKDERIILMFLVSPMTSHNEDLVISCEWVLKVEIKTQCVMILYPASKEWLITRGFSRIPLRWSSLYGEKFARTWKRAAAGVSVCLLLPVAEDRLMWQAQ